VPVALAFTSRVWFGTAFQNNLSADARFLLKELQLFSDGVGERENLMMHTGKAVGNVTVARGDAPIASPAHRMSDLHQRALIAQRFSPMLSNPVYLLGSNFRPEVAA
jgi:hypothetical protein